jgi:hypothetical protein
VKGLFVFSLLLFAQYRWCAWERAHGKKGKGLVRIVLY